MVMKKKSYLYFLADNENDLFKIGISDNYKYRIRAININFDDKKSLLFSGNAQMIRQAEKMLHAALHPYRTDHPGHSAGGITEWFNIEAYPKALKALRCIEEMWETELTNERFSLSDRERSLTRRPPNSGSVMPDSLIIKTMDHWVSAQSFPYSFKGLPLFSLASGVEGTISNTFRGVTLEVSTSEAGVYLPTLSDLDVLAWIIRSAGNEESDTVEFNYNDALTGLKKGLSGKAYSDLKRALHRLATAIVTVRGCDFSGGAFFEYIEIGRHSVILSLSHWVRQFGAIHLDDKYLQIRKPSEKLLYIIHKATCSSGESLSITTEGYSRIMGSSRPMPKVRHMLRQVESEGILTATYYASCDSVTYR